MLRYLLISARRPWPGYFKILQCIDMPIDYNSIVIDEVVIAAASDGSGMFKIKWDSSFGFGELTFHLSDEGSVRIDAEGMTKEYCKAVMDKFIQKFYI